MASARDVIVLTTSSAQELEVIAYLKPVTAHLVAGTNIINDFFAAITDVFGGRSTTYQRQLQSLYDDAIATLKKSTHDIGGNAVLGVTIDIDEVSGKGKNMFMITAVGTAVKTKKIQSIDGSNSFERITIEKFSILLQRRELMNKAQMGRLYIDDEFWQFIIDNKVSEMFPFVAKEFKADLDNHSNTPDNFTKKFAQLDQFVESLEDDEKFKLLYDVVAKENNENFLMRILKIMKDQHLFNFQQIDNLLSHAEFEVQKRGVFLATVDKPFFSKSDIDELSTLRDRISKSFSERGLKTTKRGLLTKEKEMWHCGLCDKYAEIGGHCNACNKDIYGFQKGKMNPEKASELLDAKIQTLREYFS